MSWSEPLRLTAAAMSQNRLSITTLSWNGHHLYLVPSMTAFFEMASDDQAGVQQVAGELWHYLGASEVREILVRRGPSVGPRRSSSNCTKFETILQLLPLTCAHVHVQRVIGWAKQDNWLLPLPETGLSSREAELQESAIETAAFGVACVLSTLAHHQLSTT